MVVPLIKGEIIFSKYAINPSKRRRENEQSKEKS
jgi:hypothetical protein